MEIAANSFPKSYGSAADRIAVLAGGSRERQRTTRSNTVATVTRWWVIVIGIVLAAGCGGGKKRGDTYARAEVAQQKCCEHLAGAPRDQCLGSLVRVDDAQVARTSTNQETYACVAEHFVCDPATGHATQVSAQQQLDCIQDLPQ
jgi:hypothetical protein